MAEFKASSEQQNKTASPVKSPQEESNQGEMEFLDSRNSTFQLIQLQAAADDQGKGNRIKQLQSKSIQFTSSSRIAQLQAKIDSKMESSAPVVQREENKTGIPDALKSGMESISGLSLDDVKVHRNSDKPAQLQAHAYAQGNDIHLAPGQEKHLPHELGHVVQQKEGRVKPTVQLKGDVTINDDMGLEKEADVLGVMAQAHPKKPFQLSKNDPTEVESLKKSGIQRKEIIQRQRTPAEEAAAREEFKRHFITMFSDVTWLTYGDQTRKVEDTALVVYDKLVATLAITKPAMDKVGSFSSGPNQGRKEVATTGDRYKPSSSGETKVSTGATPEFQEALKLAESFANELKELTKQSKKAKELAASGFAFWSGNPAKFAAKSSGLASLEGSALGGIFEDTKIPENVDMSIWGSISKAYAEWATEETAGKKYHGYVGLGGDGLNSIYNSVEKWAVQMATAGNKNFRILWFPVIPKLDAYTEAKLEADKNNKVPTAPITSGDQYEKKPSSSGGSDISDNGLTSRAEAEQKMRDEDVKRKNDVFNP
ncbi:MAG: hypothetical protein RL407_415 [Bacteroidota bacterium]|jgi:Domain of unknown function (DUF4157)